MPIVLKYGAPGGILGAAFSAGVGNRLQELEEEKRKREEAEADRGLRLQLQRGAFDQQKALADAQRDFLAEEGALNRQQREDLANENRYQDTLAGLASGALELPERAKAELTNIENSRVELVHGIFDDKQRQEFMDQYETRKKALISTATPVIQLPRDEQVKKNLGSSYDPEGNAKWPWLLGNHPGEMTLPPGFKPPEVQQAEQAKKDAAEQAKKDEERTDSVMRRFEKNREATNPQDPEKKLYADDDAAWQAAVDAENVSERMRQRTNQLRTPGQPASQPAAQSSQPAAQLPIVKDREELIAKGLLKPGQKYSGPDGTIYQVAQDGVSTRAIGNQVQQGTAPSAQAAIASQPQRDATSQQGGLPSAEEFDKRWANLQPGQSTRGPDGKMYTKSRL